MVRLEGDRIVDVGPRSAHIAQLPYAAFQPAASIVAPAVELIQPKADDPAGYVAIRLGDGRRVAITTTDAANVLGLVKAGDYSHGDPEAARRAMAPLVPRVRLSVEDTARRILDAAVGKVIPTIQRLVEEDRRERGQAKLV